jgi:hypothetical protein
MTFLIEQESDLCRVATRVATKDGRAPAGLELCAIVLVVRLNISRFRGHVNVKSFASLTLAGMCCGGRRIRVLRKTITKKRSFPSLGFSRGPFHLTGTCTLGDQNLELVRLHIHAQPAKPHPLSFQPEALLHRGVASQLDRSARAQHSLPGQSKSAPQDRSNLSRRPRKPRRPRHPAISRYFPPRNRANRPLNPHPHLSRRIIFLFCHPERSRRIPQAFQ